MDPTPRDEEFQTAPGRYDLVTRLGQGGMADVYLGWMHSVGGIRRKVAVKRILPDLARKRRELFERMFEDEARLAFLLEHDNIVRVYDVGQSANTFFVVMEYVDGLDLRSLAAVTSARDEPVDVADVLFIGAGVAQGLAYAHSFTDGYGRSLAVVHNDISPPNILVGRQGEVKIADFGLADARSHAAETPAGIVKGKLAYLSHEATLDPDLVSSRSDIFSLGIVLWELLANRRLFHRDTDQNTLMAVRECQIPDLREIRPEVPARLVEIVGHALDPDPGSRYATAEALGSDLVELSYQLGLPISRHRLGRLVNRVKGKERQEPEGERLEDAEAAAILDELEVMLPPGVAEYLSSFVTDFRVEAEPDTDETAQSGEHSWRGLLDEVGFKGDESLFEDLGRYALWRQIGLRTGRRRAVTVRRPASGRADVPSQGSAREEGGGRADTQSGSQPEAANSGSPQAAQPDNSQQFGTRELVLVLLLGLGVGVPLGILLGILVFGS